MDALTLTLKNTIVQNNDFFGLNVNAGANLQVENCIFSDAGICSAYLFAGGEYHFRHCDFVNYWNGSRSGPAFALTNWWKSEGTVYCRDVTTSEFFNCVAWGNTSNEWLVDTIDCGGITIDFNVSHCLMAKEQTYDYTNYTGCLWNQDPLFTDAVNHDFHYGTGSPLNNNGTGPGESTAFDLEGNMRASTNPDIGCYELP